MSEDLVGILRKVPTSVRRFIRRRRRLCRDKSSPVGRLSMVEISIAQHRNENIIHSESVRTLGLAGWSRSKVGRLDHHVGLWELHNFFWENKLNKCRRNEQRGQQLLRGAVLVDTYSPGCIPRYRLVCSWAFAEQRLISRTGSGEKAPLLSLLVWLAI